MSNSNNSVWRTLQAWRTTTFTIAGLIFIACLVLLAINLVEGTPDQNLTLGQAFIGTAWTATFIGLLGFYASLANESRWILRFGTIFAMIGLITSLFMAVVMFGLFFGVIGGSYSSYMMYFVPGFFLGIPLGCGLYSVASLRTTVYRQRMGLLFLLLPGAFLFNYGTSIFLGIHSVAKIFGVIAVLTITNFTIGYMLKTGSAEIRPEGDTSLDTTS